MTRRELIVLIIIITAIWICEIMVAIHIREQNKRLDVLERNINREQSR